jgi:hypothetical protein
MPMDEYFEMDQIGEPGQIFGVGGAGYCPAGNDHKTLFVVEVFVPGVSISTGMQQFLQKVSCACWALYLPGHSA